MIYGEMSKEEIRRATEGVMRYIEWRGRRIIDDTIESWGREAMMIYTEAQKKKISEEAKGLVVKSLKNVEDGDDSYWVMTFTNGSEISFRFMAELIRSGINADSGDRVRGTI